MALAPTLVLLAVGSSLLALVTVTTVPVAAGLALTLLLHASRSLHGLAWPLCVCPAIYVALAIGNRGIVPVSGPAYFVIIAGLTTAFTVPFAVDRFGTERMSTGLGATLLFPVTFVAVELLRARLTSAATWGSLAYTQYGNLALMQVAAVAGIFGITFVVTWTVSTFDWALIRQFEWNVVRTPVVACATVVGLVLIGGSLRVAFAPTDQPSLRAAAVNRPVDLFVPGEMTRIAEGRLTDAERASLGIKLKQLHNWFLDSSRREARAGARLVAWPEMNLLIFADDEQAFVERARRLASDERIYLAMGLGTVHNGAILPLENKLIVIDPAGRIVMSYLKSHAVEGWEAGIMRVGDGRQPVVATEDGRLAGAICFDADFPEFIRQSGAARADVLIVPANEWKAIKSIHAQMASFRAIENGVPIVRPAASGISTAFDPWGRLLGMADYFSPGSRTMTAQVPIGGVRTLYSRTGDLFAWSCVAFVALAPIIARWL